MFGFGKNKSESAPEIMTVDRAVEKCADDEDIIEACREILALEAWNRSDPAAGDHLATALHETTLTNLLKQKGILLADEEAVKEFVLILGA